MTEIQFLLEAERQKQFCVSFLYTIKEEFPLAHVAERLNAPGAFEVVIPIKDIGEVSYFPSNKFEGDTSMNKQFHAHSPQGEREMYFALNRLDELYGQFSHHSNPSIKLGSKIQILEEYGEKLIKEMFSLEQHGNRDKYPELLKKLDDAMPMCINHSLDEKLSEQVMNIYIAMNERDNLSKEAFNRQLTIGDEIFESMRRGGAMQLPLVGYLAQMYILEKQDELSDKIIDRHRFTLITASEEELEKEIFLTEKGKIKLAHNPDRMFKEIVELDAWVPAHAIERGIAKSLLASREKFVQASEYISNIEFNPQGELTKLSTRFAFDPDHYSEFLPLPSGRVQYLTFSNASEQGMLVNIEQLDNMTVVANKLIQAVKDVDLRETFGAVLARKQEAKSLRIQDLFELNYIHSYMGTSSTLDLYDQANKSKQTLISSKLLKKEPEYMAFIRPFTLEAASKNTILELSEISRVVNSRQEEKNTIISSIKGIFKQFGVEETVNATQTLQPSAQPVHDGKFKREV